MPATATPVLEPRELPDHETVEVECTVHGEVTAEAIALSAYEVDWTCPVTGCDEVGTLQVDPTEDPDL